MFRFRTRTAPIALHHTRSSDRRRAHWRVRALGLQPLLAHVQLPAPIQPAAIQPLPMSIDASIATPTSTPKIRIVVPRSNPDALQNAVLPDTQVKSHDAPQAFKSVRSSRFTCKPITKLRAYVIGRTSSKHGKLVLSLLLKNGADPVTLKPAANASPQAIVQSLGRTSGRNSRSKPSYKATAPKRRRNLSRSPVYIPMTCQSRCDKLAL